MGGGFGVTIDMREDLWISNFGWGEPKYYSVNGGVSVFNLAGDAQSPDLQGYVGKPATQRSQILRWKSEAQPSTVSERCIRISSN